MYVRRGAILLRNQQFDRALADCDQAIELAPNDELAYLNRARVWSARNDYVRAGADLDEAVRLDPTNPDAWLDRSRYWVHENKPDKALNDVNEALRLSPDDATVRRWRGRIWAGQGNQDGAIADYTQAIRLDPTDAASFVSRAQARLEKGEHDLAIADSTEAIKLEPGRASLYVFRGDVRSEHEEYDKAIADYNHAIRLDPKYAAAYACRARAWAGKHERERETVDYTEAIKLDPTNVWYHRSRANSWSIQGMHVQAIAGYNEALRIDPNNPANYVARGLEWQKDSDAAMSSDFDKALADFDRATELDPTYADAYLYRGRIWKRRREFDKVVREFATLIERNPDSPVGHQGSPGSWRPVGLTESATAGGPSTRQPAPASSLAGMTQTAWTRSPRPMPRRATSHPLSSGRIVRSSFSPDPPSQAGICGLHSMAAGSIIPSIDPAATEPTILAPRLLPSNFGTGRVSHLLNNRTVTTMFLGTVIPRMSPIGVEVSFASALMARPVFPPSLDGAPEDETLNETRSRGDARVGIDLMLPVSHRVNGRLRRQRKPPTGG